MGEVQIDAQAVVSPEAKLGKGVQVGAFAVVGSGVELGEGCVLHEHAVVRGPAKFGARNVFHPFTVIGAIRKTIPIAGSTLHWPQAMATFFAST